MLDRSSLRCVGVPELQNETVIDNLARFGLKKKVYAENDYEDQNSSLLGRRATFVRLALELFSELDRVESFRFSHGTVSNNCVLGGVGPTQRRLERRATNWRCGPLSG